MLDRMLLASTSTEALYVEDVFSTYLYTGNGSTQTITNGIDLAGKGGMTWIKGRSISGYDHYVVDSASGSLAYALATNATRGKTFDFTPYSYVSSFNNNGFSLATGAGDKNDVNGSGTTYASWTFREAPKFFDVVTYTGNDTSRSIAHNLGVAPGCIIVKNISQSGFNWVVYHRSTGATQWLKLNLTDAVATNATYFPTDPTATTFAIGSGGLVNGGGDTYVAYLFAHDAAADGIIQCGSYTAGGSPVVTLGWEPQWLMIKNATTGDVYQDWYVFDNMRKLDVSNSGNAPLRANTSGAEGGTYATSSYNLVQPRATGFVVDPSGAGASGVNNGSDTYIYIAIRRGPMKTPTVGTSVFGMATGYSSDTANVQTGIVVDAGIQTWRNTGTDGQNLFASRLTGKDMQTSSTSGETFGLPKFDSMNGYTPYYAGSVGALNPILWSFRRAPGFFDVVCYTGNGTAGRTVNHNLGVAPELMIIKIRSASNDWRVYYNPNSSIYLNTNQAGGTASSVIWNNTDPTATVFSVGIDSSVNGSGGTYVAYLFASCPGVSKVGSYTGNGSSQTINCGFSSGARFFLVKRTDSTGDWWAYDSARGIIAAADPALSINSSNAEITSADAVDTDSTGIIVNQEATCNINVNGATYIYLAVA